MPFPIAEAQLAALFMQSIAYGIHVVTFAACMYAWFWRHRTLRASNRWPWMVVAIALFIFGTIDVCFNFYHNLVAFVFFTGPGGANAEFEDISNWINVMRSVWWYLQALISDAALIYRCWIIYQRLLVVLLLPVLLWVAAAVCAALAVYYMFELKQATTIPSAKKIQPYYHTVFATSLAVNIITTGLMVYRIWSMQKLSSGLFTKTWRGSGRVNLSQVNRIFVESALLYTLSVAITLVTELAKTNGNYGTSDMSLELAGVSFDLIIIRIWSGVSTEPTAPEFAPTLDFADREATPSKADNRQRRTDSLGTVTRDVTELSIEHAGTDWTEYPSSGTC
ncbi:uncharacterized protein B0H18DRAFT_1015365 [Fomitopsis serialis]|uniref:uncharacterized protein n=1 Tax=Fomitopsis serialis TaxID=139415 RepID=UPI002008B299|nr:uncharacterized protein B0H18DRAFT_1015365 [Neoantrodia serialis]KAH9923360.1 hypothetical protein B0H18DRAFT_1015365 [Neoantrodia serialis]